MTCQKNIGNTNTNSTNTINHDDNGASEDEQQQPQSQPQEQARNGTTWTNRARSPMEVMLSLMLSSSDYDGQQQHLRLDPTNNFDIRSITLPLSSYSVPVVAAAAEDSVIEANFHQRRRRRSHRPLSTLEAIDQAISIVNDDADFELDDNDQHDIVHHIHDDEDEDDSRL
jgi:hypothetical protein